MIEGESYWPRLIKSVRSRENLTQTALAAWLGVDQTTVSRWERGQDAPAFRLRQRIRDLYRQRAAGKQDLVARPGFAMRSGRRLWWGPAPCSSSSTPAP